MSSRRFLWVFLALGVAISAHADDPCLGKLLSSPLSRPLHVRSGFQGRRHEGVDYESDDDSVLAIADGQVVAIRWDLRPLPRPNPRTGLSTQGWGRYVVIRHDDGSESLYAHLKEGSTAGLQPGMRVKKGQVIGKSDSSGAVTGPHLHFEFSSKGSIYGHANKRDANLCIVRPVAALLEDVTDWVGGEMTVSLDDRTVGGKGQERSKKFNLPLVPGVHRLGIHLVKALSGKAGGYLLELGENATSVDSDGEILGPGNSETNLSEGQSKTVLIRLRD